MQQIVMINKEDAQMWTALGDAYKRRGNFQSAVKAYREALELEPENDVTRIQVISLFKNHSIICYICYADEVYLIFVKFHETTNR